MFGGPHDAMPDYDCGRWLNYDIRGRRCHDYDYTYIAEQQPHMVRYHPRNNN